MSFDFLNVFSKGSCGFVFFIWSNIVPVGFYLKIITCLAFYVLLTSPFLSAKTSSKNLLLFLVFVFWTLLFLCLVIRMLALAMSFVLNEQISAVNSVCDPVAMTTYLTLLSISVFLSVNNRSKINLIEQMWSLISIFLSNFFQKAIGSAEIVFSRSHFLRNIICSIPSMMTFVNSFNSVHPQESRWVPFVRATHYMPLISWNIKMTTLAIRLIALMLRLTCSRGELMRSIKSSPSLLRSFSF